MYASRFLILCLHTLLIGKCTKLIACAEAVTFAMKISVAIGEQKFNWDENDRYNPLGDAYIRNQFVWTNNWKKINKLKQ